MSEAQAQAKTLPWVEKYRPEVLSDVVAQTEIVSTLQNFIETDGEVPHLLFYGPPGTGKTTTILACARSLGGPRFRGSILELNASDSRGIDVVRENIKDFASTASLTGKHKLIILDEADQMTGAAQAALRRVMEKYTRNARFCLICNYSAKIIPALQSRCTRFRFGPLNDDAVAARLREISEIEGVSVSADGIEALVALGGGDMRKSINLLQSTHLSFDRVDRDSVYSCAGQPLPTEVEQILSWLLKEDIAAAYEHIEELRNLRGFAVGDVLREVHQLVLRLDIPRRARIYLLDLISTVEFRLSKDTSERIQLASLVGGFHMARSLILESSSTTLS